MYEFKPSIHSIHLSIKLDVLMKKNNEYKSNMSRRSIIAGAAGITSMALGTGIGSADSAGKEDLSAAFDTMISRHGNPRENGVAVVKDGQHVYTSGEALDSPPHAVGIPSIGTAYVFDDGFETEYWCSLDHSGNKQKAWLNGDSYWLSFTKSDQSTLSKKMERSEISALSQGVATNVTSDIQLSKGNTRMISPNTMTDGDTYQNVLAVGETSQDLDLSAREGYADAKVFAGGQSESMAEIWMTISSPDSGGVTFTISGTWSGSIVATPGTSAKGEVSVFIRNAGSEQDIDSSTIMTHTAPVYGDYWQNMNSYEKSSGDNTVFASIDSNTTYEVGVRLRCTSSALGTSGPLPGSVRSDFYRKNEPLDPTQDRKFASFDKVECEWPNT